MLASWLSMREVVTTAQSAGRLVPSTEHHAVTAAGHGLLDATILALGVLVVIVTTIYALLWLVRPGEAGAEHIKRRILEEGREGSR